MEVLPVHSFKVKSSSGNYSVDFIYDFKQELQKELKDHDTIIIDEKIVELYPNSLKVFKSKYKNNIHCSIRKKQEL